MTGIGETGRKAYKIEGENGEMKIVTCNFSKRDLKLIEYYIGKGECPCRSEFIRRALAFYLEKLAVDERENRKRFNDLEKYFNSKVIRRLE